MSKDRYKLASWIYDAVTLAYSGGAIWQTRKRCFDALECSGLGSLSRAEPNAARVLVPGPGTGESAVLAARRGAEVVAVDRSAAMLARAARRSRRAGAPVHFVHGTLGSISPGARFDLVVAEHFLNVFRTDAMPRVRERLIAHVAPGGFLAIADFAPIDHRRALPLQCFQRIHHVIPLAGCAMLTRNAMHPIYDHGADLRDHESLVPVRTFDARSFRIGPRWFRTWIFQRVSAPRTSAGPA